MFNLTLAEVITVLGMCAATYSSRLLGYLFLRRKKLSPQTRKLLDAAPGCVMVSVVAPAFMTTNPADLVTLIVVVFLAKKTQLGGDDGACRGVECPFTASFLRYRKCSVPR